MLLIDSENPRKTVIYNNRNQVKNKNKLFFKSVYQSRLKQMLRCTSETYSSYYRFNDLILKKCHKEITEKTDLQFSYQPTDKKGRKYTNLQFTIETQEQIDCQLAFDELADVPQISDQSEDYENGDEKWVQVYGSEWLAILADECRFEFDKAQMEQIFTVLLRINIPKDYLTQDITYGRAAYFSRRYAALNAEAAKKKRNGDSIKNRFKYFLKMLEDDTFQPAAYKTD